MTITHEQDVSRHLDLAHEMAVDQNYTANGMKRDMWHYAHVPNTTVLKMLQEDGVDLFNKGHVALRTCAKYHCDEDVGRGRR